MAICIHNRAKFSRRMSGIQHAKSRFASQEDKRAIMVGFNMARSPSTQRVQLKRFGAIRESQVRSLSSRIPGCSIRFVKDLTYQQRWL